ncbi:MULTISPECIES: protein kinase domain-containing protein [unclassified Frankia]
MGSGRSEPGDPLNPHEPRSVGPYVLLSRLGVGGMGTVYLARNRAGRRVAIKVIRPDLAADEEFRRRFRAEVEAARKVAPFCTAEVLDADPNAPAPYLVTEFIDGVRLDMQVDKGPLTSSILTGLAVGVATALTAIHSAGLVHRDLKPSNVMLSLSGPRVIDFGIAQALEGAKAKPTAWGFGSAGWMAPEQVHGQPIGPEADVFAWGILIAYAGTGRHPFGDGTDIDLGMRIVGSAPDLRGLPQPLVGLVSAALAKHPDDRPSARDLLLRLIAQPPSRGTGAIGEAMGQAEEFLSRTGEVPRAAPTRIGAATSVPARQVPWNAGAPAARAGQGPGQPRQAPPGQPDAHSPMGRPGPRPAQVGARPPAQLGGRMGGQVPGAPPGPWSGQAPDQHGPVPGEPGAPYPPFAQPPAARGLDRRRLVWIAAIVLSALIAIAVVVSLPGKTGKSGQNGSAEQLAATTAPSRSTGPSTASGSASGLNRPVTDGQLEFIVDSFRCGQTKLGDGLLARHTDGQFCLAHVTVRNLGDSTRTLVTSSQFLWDGGGGRHSADFLARLQLSNEDLWDSINPGDLRAGTMVFDISREATAQELELHDNPVSGGVRVPVP